jgi:hypothetical protein
MRKKPANKVTGIEWDERKKKHCYARELDKFQDGRARAIYLSRSS